MSGERHPPGGRGLALLSAHCRSLDPTVPSARARLERKVGAELAAVLVSGLAGSGASALRCAV
jgi:hypothetical protein